MNIRISCLSGHYHKAQKKNRQSFLLFITLFVCACSVSESTPKAVSSPSFSKADAIIIAQNDLTADAGKKAFERGGNAADAMAAMLATGSVVLPSKMGIGAGGVCQILSPQTGHVETLGFLSEPMTFDKKIGTPSLPKGLFRLQNKYGIRPWKEVFTNAIYLAQNGISISDELAKDIINTQGLPQKWKQLKKGDLLKQEKLAETLSVLSDSAVDVLYKGKMAESIVSQSDQIIQEDLKSTKINIMDSIDASSNTGKTFFANPAILSSDGYMLWKNLQSKNPEKNSQALQEIKQIQNRNFQTQDSVQGVSFFSADKSGLVVACTVSLGSSFGSKQLTQEGFFLSSPIHPQDRGFVFFNALTTNPDITDVIYSLQAVGNNALAEGTSYMANKQLEVSSEQINTDSIFIELSCEKGFPNNATSCQENKFLHKVKQDLTK